MNTKALQNWVGISSILWMVGGYAFIRHVMLPHNLQFEPFWLYMLVLFFGWLGVGLLLAVTGLRRGNWAGRIFAFVAIGVFIFFAWLMVSPVFERAHVRAMQPNNSLQATAVAPASCD
jgi:hypothetical protein